MPIQSSYKIVNLLAYWAQNAASVCCIHDGGLGGISDILWIKNIIYLKQVLYSKHDSGMGVNKV